MASRSFSFLKKEFEKHGLTLENELVTAGKTGKAAEKKRSIYMLYQGDEFIIAFLSPREAKAFLIGYELSQNKKESETDKLINRLLRD